MEKEPVVVLPFDYFHEKELRSRNPMPETDPKILSLQKFSALFMGNNERYSKADPIQVFPLEAAPNNIRVPTPTFRANYNFLLVFRSGGGIQQVDGERVDLAQNDVLFIRESHLNAILSIHPDTSGYFIYLDNEVLNGIFEDSTLLSYFTFNPKISLDLSDRQWIEKACSLLEDSLKSKANYELATTLLKAIFLRLSNGIPFAAGTNTRQFQITMRFKEHVYRNFKVQQSPSFYADHLSISENYLHRCVRKTTGKSPKTHITEIQISEAKMLLVKGEADIAQIAYTLGFSSPSHFGNVFKKITGLTPSQYLKQFSQEF